MTEPVPFRSALALIAALALASCVTGQGERPQSSVYYDCQATATVPGGKVSVVRWLAADGSPNSTVVVWTPSVPDTAGLWFVARWDALAQDAVDFNRGLVMFDVKFDRGPPGSDRTRRLVLRARPVGPWDGYAFLEGRMKLSNGMRLSADWADVQAMAQGADQIYLLSLDRKGTVIAQRRLDKSMFEGFHADAERLLAETSAMAAEYQSRCHSSAEDANIVL